MKKDYLLTIGMPSYYDYTGTLFTVEIIREFHDFQKGDVEILVVDNSSSDKYRKDLEREIKGMKDVKIRYIPFPTQRGPAETKNVVIENARGEYTLCIDCHVSLRSGVVNRLRDFLKNLKEEDRDNFYVGPLVHNAGSLHTHFDPVWRNQMWGIWGSDKSLLQDDTPKDVWAQGCGLFLVNTDSWLGFNKNFNGFGGEEGYIHEKYRKAGRKVQILPWLKWWHRFGNPDAKQYNNNVYAKTRNYVIGHLEIGKDIQPIHEHFVDLKFEGDLREHLISTHGVDAAYIKDFNDEQLEGVHRSHKITEYQWSWLTGDPLNRLEPEVNPARDIYPFRLKDEKNLIRKHYPTLKKYAEKCSYVADITRYAYSTVPLMTHRPKYMLNYVYETAPDQTVAGSADIRSFETFEEAAENFTSNEKAEMLFVKFPHEYKYAADHLVSLAGRVSRYLAIHDTVWGYNQDIANAMKILVASGEWFVLEHSNEAWGLTILSREKPEKQAIAWQDDIPEGAGAELKKLLARIAALSESTAKTLARVGIKPKFLNKFYYVASKQCSCNTRAKIMDSRGTKWCLENKDMILDWLQEEAKKQGKFFFRFGARLILNRAIKLAEKKQK